MKNPSGNKLEKLVFRIFDQMVEGADKYVTKQGSTWLIFTESKKWIIEFTKDKTLWFNYNLFQNELDLIGKDCTEERDLIKNWFESRFLNKPKVRATFNHAIDSSQAVEDTIENGVKDTSAKLLNISRDVEDTIQNGVKETIVGDGNVTCYGEDAIQNGVKNTSFYYDGYNQYVEDTIENGVKETQTRMWPPVGAVDETIENGVKETTPSGYLGSIEMKGKIVHQIESPKQNNEVEDTIQNGVKEAKEDRLFRTIHVMNAIVNGVKHVEDGDWLDQDERIDDIIENGVKETKESMLESLEQIDHQVTNCEITENINDAIENGVKETKEMKHSRNRYHGHFILKDDIPTYIPMVQVQDVIENGVKEVKEISNFDLTSEIFKVNAKRAIKDGVKELKELPDKSGEFRGYGDWYHRQEDRTKPHTEYVKEVIEDSYNHMGRVEGVIRNTDKDGI